MGGGGVMYVDALLTTKRFPAPARHRRRIPPKRKSSVPGPRAKAFALRQTTLFAGRSAHTSTSSEPACRTRHATQGCVKKKGFSASIVLF